ncbi:MAG: hypothetical protein ACI8XG_000350 [Congregibacter sp.]|jgi:hypothetical protein
MKVLLVFGLTVLFMVLPVKVFSQEMISITAVGSHKYSLFKKSSARDAALKEAKFIGLKKYISSMPVAKQRMLNNLIDDIEDNIDVYVTETVIQQEKQDKQSSQYKVAISAKINPTALDILLLDNSESGTQAVGDARAFGAMFIARVEASRKSFDVKRIDVSEVQKSASIEEATSSDGERNIQAINEKGLSVKKIGGSSEAKRDDVEYETSIAISEEVAYAVEEHLVNAGFEPMGIDQLDDVPFLDEIVDQMRVSGRMPTRIRKAYQNAAIEAGWTFLGMGTIDIGTPQSDSARGTIRVPATVSFRVWILDDGRARSVASVRPQVVYGQDRGNSSVAETNAYNEAAKFAMDIVVSQLQQKGLR